MTLPSRSLSRTVRRLGLAALLGATTTCSSEGPNPPNQDPAAIAPISGDAQAAPAGSALPDLLVVEVTDAGGDPVAGVQVQWEAVGGGSVSNAVVATGADGRSSVQRVLGTQVGEQITTATVAGLTGSPVQFSAEAQPLTGPRLGVTTQPSGTAESGAVLAQQPVIQLQDENGGALAQAGVTVTASVGAQGVALGGTTARATNDQGQAVFTDLALTGPAGSYPIRFTAAGYNEALSSPVTLSAGQAATLTLLVQPPTSALRREVWSPDRQPVARLVNEAGQPVQGTVVTATVASGSGTLEGTTTATTDGDGAAFFGDLGIDGTGSHTLQFTAGAASVVSDAVSLEALTADAASGKWDPQIHAWDIVPLHMSMLPTGKIIAWGKFEAGGTMMAQPRLWDPTQGEPTGAITVANDTMLFCAGHTLMADGRLMVSGGHKEDDRGLDITNIFDPGSESWVPGLPKMDKGRWYPTVTTLPDGRIVTVAGKDTAKTVVRVPEIWENNQWVRLPGASLLLPYYPRDFVDPKTGRLFYAGERVMSRWLDVDGSTAAGRGRWIDGPSHIYPFNREYGSAAMYDTGKILYVGGGGDPGWDTPDQRADVPTATAEKIDLTAASPSWSSAGSMGTRRRHLNATVLPDGRVLVTGGISGGGELNNMNGTGVKAAELWDPATNEWTTLASQQVTRAYHSVSLLMKDGTVLSGASGDAFVPGTGEPYPAERNHEIFRPPYLFKGARPTIASAPSDVAYGATFTVTTPNAGQVTDVRWIRLPSVTHAFDASARANTLSFTRTTSGVEVQAPSGPNLAPPGHYMLFILNRNGVPSNGEVIRIH